MRKKKVKECVVDWDKVSREVDKFCLEMDKFWKKEEKKISLKKLPLNSPITHNIIEYEDYLFTKLREELNGKIEER